MRDDLNSSPEVIAAPFFGDDGGINTPCCDVVALASRHTGKALVMAQIQVGFSAIIGDKYLTVLGGAHRARIDVEVGVELAQSNLISARL